MHVMPYGRDRAAAQNRRSLVSCVTDSKNDTFWHAWASIRMSKEAAPGGRARSAAKSPGQSAAGMCFCTCVSLHVYMLSPHAHSFLLARLVFRSPHPFLSFAVSLLSPPHHSKSLTLSRTIPCLPFSLSHARARAGSLLLSHKLVHTHTHMCTHACSHSRSLAFSRFLFLPLSRSLAL